MKLGLPTLPLGVHHVQKGTDALKDLFAGRMRNVNTRTAYLYAWENFIRWCKTHGLQLEFVRERHVGAWVESHLGSERTVRQHLAAVRKLFDILVEKQILEFNPAARVKAEKFNDPKSRTATFEPEEAKRFFQSLNNYTLQNQRNLALARVLFHHCPRISAVINLRVRDYYLKDNRRWLRFREKGGKYHDLPVHPRARSALDDWLVRSGLIDQLDAPLFSAFERDRESLTLQKLNRRSIYKLIRRLTRKLGIKKRIGCHSFRATGITFFRMNGGSLEDAARLANHANLSTTKGYDRTFDMEMAGEIERVDIPEENYGA
ncbi:MAG: tyrosine-type recombinase/integrase [Chthoniobacterales bacterium]